MLRSLITLLGCWLSARSLLLYAMCVYFSIFVVWNWKLHCMQHRANDGSLIFRLLSDEWLWMCLGSSAFWYRSSQMKPLCQLQRHSEKPSRVGRGVCYCVRMSTKPTTAITTARESSSSLSTMMMMRRSKVWKHEQATNERMEWTNERFESSKNLRVFIMAWLWRNLPSCLSSASHGELLSLTTSGKAAAARSTTLRDRVPSERKAKEMRWDIKKNCNGKSSLCCSLLGFFSVVD